MWWIIIVPTVLLIYLFTYQEKVWWFLLWAASWIFIWFCVDPTSGFWIFVISSICIGGGTETSSSSSGGGGDGGGESSFPDIYDKRYENGTKRVKNISETGYIYSDGTESWNSMLGEEHRSNGEVVYENAYIPGRRDIYKNGEYIGYEYEDSVGITHRVSQ